MNGRDKLAEKYLYLLQYFEDKFQESLSLEFLSILDKIDTSNNPKSFIAQNLYWSGLKAIRKPKPSTLIFDAKDYYHIFDKVELLDAVSHLTGRCKEVANHLSKGLDRFDICEILGIGMATYYRDLDFIRMFLIDEGYEE